MVKRLFKRSIACLLAVLMIATSLPLTALADSTTDNVTVEKTATVDCVTTGLVSDGSRYKTSYYEIVNDSADNAFSVGYWKYKTSDFSASATEYTAAPFTLNFQNPVFADSTDTNISLSVYYSTNGQANDGHNGASTGFPSSLSSKNIDGVVSYYGLTKIADLSRTALTNGGTATVDVKDAVNYAIAQKLQYVTIMVMCSQASASGSPWSDIYVTAKTPSITATYNEEIEVIPGVAGIDAQISAYESKMSNVGKNGVVYKDMLPAYQAYMKAVRYRDAFAYGGKDAPTEDELNAAAEDLATKSASMTAWTDEVTGKFESKVPTFNASGGQLTVTDTSNYGNIIYTEDCVGKNNGKNGGDSSGMAIAFDFVGDVYVQLYYPNTILLYDGKSDAVLPIMFMAKTTVSGSWPTSKPRYVYQVYPAQSPQKMGNMNYVNDQGWKTTKPNDDGELVGRSVITGQQTDTWRGKDGSNTLDYNYARNQGYYVGVNQANTYSTNSQKLGYSSGGYWNSYAAPFQISSNIKFDGSNEGYKSVGDFWAWYGGSAESYSAGIDANLNGYAQSEAASDHTQKKIYVINYKGLAEQIGNVQKLQYMPDVASYKQGGLTDIITAFDNATSYANMENIKNINLTNLQTEGTKINNAIKGIRNAKAPTADTGAASYANLKTAITNAKKYYNAGNENYEKYTQEVWDPFQTAYENATNYFYNLYTNDLVMADAEQYIEPLNLAKDDLKNGMIRKVVDTSVLENAIDNAEALAHNSVYFKAGTVDADALAALVKEIKVAIWQSEENYGYDTEKVDLTDENTAKVNAYIEQLCAEIVKAQINLDYVTTSNYSLTTALAKAETFNTSDANDKYGNYATLQAAVNKANTYKSSVETYNGRVQGVVENSVSNYINLVKDVVDGFTNLQPAFRLIANGTVANKGTPYKSEFQSSARGDQYKFYWEYTTGSIIFKTKPEEYVYTLPTSRWGSYNKQTGTGFETCLDSIILDANNVKAGELSSTSTGGTGWPSGNGIPANIKDDYNAQLSLSAGITMAIDSVKVTKSTGKAVGIDAAGNYITDLNHDFVTELSTTEGTANMPTGGIYAKNGWTEFDTTTKFTMPVDAFSLSATSLPSKYSKYLDLGTSNAYFGVVYFWKYAPTLIVTWAGYGFERAKYNFNIGFVDVVPLFNLIEECSDKDFFATSSQYTTSSWNTLLSAVTEANANMDYANMTYQQIVDECDLRYTKLWNAKKNLKKAANNTKLKEAISAAKKAYEEDQAKVKASSWTAFQTAYENALSVFNGKYSDLNITDVASSDQSDVDSYATALTDAFNALVYQIDFAPLKAAAESLVNSIESDKYTAESLTALSNALASLKYLNMSTSEQAKHYTDETEVVAAINQELADIPNYKETYLKETTVDTSALEGAKATAKAKLADADAYDQDAVNAAVAALSATQTINVRGVNITARKYATQEACDADVAAALSGIQLKKYTVQIVPNGDESQAYTKGTYDYGTELTVSLPDKPVVDWYYESTSPSAKVAKKLATTTDEFVFVVKGDTVLTTKSSSKTSTEYKVSYVNGVNSSVVDIKYVAAGSTITLDESIVPELPYYTFDSFIVNGVEKKAGDTITVNSNTGITICYTFNAAKTYTVRVADFAFAYVGGNVSIDGLKYNDEVSFKAGTPGEDDGYAGYTLKYDVTTYDDAQHKYVTETRSIADYGRCVEGYVTGDIINPAVYAWLEVGSDDIETWWSKASTNPENPDLSELFIGDTVDRNFTDWAIEHTKGSKVVKYGEDYTFRVYKDVVLLPLDKAAYDKAVEAGIVDASNDELMDENGASIDTSSEVVVTPGTKLSIISNFTLPEDCELVEKGILVKVNKNGPVEDTTDIKIANAGKNGVIRLKSNYTTAGDQYVISIGTSAIAGKKISDVGLAWVAYVTYKKDGKLYTKCTNVTTPTNDTSYNNGEY